MALFPYGVQGDMGFALGLNPALVLRVLVCIPSILVEDIVPALSIVSAVAVLSVIDAVPTIAVEEC